MVVVHVHLRTVPALHSGRRRVERGHVVAQQVILPLDDSCEHVHQELLAAVDLAGGPERRGIRLKQPVTQNAHAPSIFLFEAR